MCKLNLEPNRCVYVHRKLSDGSIFYVGKGTKKRARSGRNRSVYWQRVADKYGWKLEIIQENISDAQAFLLEKKLISEIGREKLCNMTDGGEGCQGRKISESHKSKLRNRFKGVRPSDICIEKSVARNSKAIGTVCGLRFSSAAEAIRALAPKKKYGAWKASISGCLRGKSIKAYGYEWGFVQPDGSIEKQKEYNQKTTRVKNQMGFVFNSPQHAADWLFMFGLGTGKSSNIIQSCKKENRKTFGIKWNYA